VRATVLLAPSLALLILPPVAHGGGMEVGDTGAEALGRGGAFVAKADNPTAINYNPAGFVKLRGHHIAVSASAVRSVYDFTRAGFGGQRAAGDGEYATINNSAPWFAAPLHMMATTDLGLFDHVTLAAGFYAPSATSRAYPREIEDATGKKTPAPQRFDMVEMGGLMLFPSVGVAFRPVGWLDIGLTFQWAISSVQTTTIATAATACDVSEDPACDIVMDIKAKDLFAPSGSAGVLFRPIPGLELGALLRLPSKSEMRGSADVTVGSGLKRLEPYFKYPIMDPDNPEITITNTYPLMVRLGGRYIFYSGDEEQADIEADLIFENWASASERRITVAARSLDKPMEDQILDSRLKNTFGLRIGGSYRIQLARSLQLILRGGALAETESTGVSDTNLQTLGPRRLGLTSGLGLRWGGVSMDMAYAHLFLPSRVVNQSTTTAMDFTSPAGGPVVGNGTYRASIDMFSVQLTVAFGGSPAPEPNREPVGPIRERIEEQEPLPPSEPEIDPDDPGINPDFGSGVRARGATHTPAPARRPQPRRKGGLQFDAETVYRSDSAAAASAARPHPAPAANPPRARVTKKARPLEVKDEVNALMVEEEIPVGDEVDQLMGKRRVKRARPARRYRRHVRRHQRRLEQASRVKRRAEYRSMRRRYRRPPAGARCIRRDDLGRCLSYRHRGRIYLSRR